MVFQILRQSLNTVDANSRDRSAPLAMQVFAHAAGLPPEPGLPELLRLLLRPESHLGRWRQRVAVQVPDRGARVRRVQRRDALQRVPQAALRLVVRRRASVRAS